MTKIAKLIQKLNSNPKDMTWNELQNVMRHFGFTEYSGKGSSRKFINANGKVLMLHEPHPNKILKPYQVKLAIKALEQ